MEATHVNKIENFNVFVQLLVLHPYGACYAGIKNAPQRTTEPFQKLRAEVS